MIPAIGDFDPVREVWPLLDTSTVPAREVDAYRRRSDAEQAVIEWEDGE